MPGGDAGLASIGTGGSGTATSGAVDGQYSRYLGLVRRRLQDTLEYPDAARRRDLVGTVHIDIVIRADGSITDIVVARSSSHAILDRASVDALRRLRPVPFPAGLEPRTLRARLPVTFQLR